MWFWVPFSRIIIINHFISLLNFFGWYSYVSYENSRAGLWVFEAIHCIWLYWKKYLPELRLTEKQVTYMLRSLDIYKKGNPTLQNFLKSTLIITHTLSVAHLAWDGEQGRCFRVFHYYKLCYSDHYAAISLYSRRWDIEYKLLKEEWLD